MAELIAVTARMSERTPRDGRGVRLLAGLAEGRTGTQAAVVAGRDGPFGQTPWEDDLEASRDVLRRAGDAVGVALARGAPVLALAPDCALAIGTLPAVAVARPDASVLWLDAHCDYDMPATTTIGFLGCMSLAGATGAWTTGLAPALDPARVVLVGTRPPPGDFDEAAQRAVEASPVTVVPPGRQAAAAVLGALGDAPVYVHFDPDVLDPAENPAPYARPGGLSLAALAGLLAAVAERGPVVGVEVTAFHSQDDEAVRTALAGRLLDVVLPLVA